MKFYGELLILVLLLITNLRVFFVEQVKKDPLVSLAPFTFFLSILQIAAWGLDVFNAAGFVIALLVFLSNFHAMFRYSERLFVDHYSPLMKCWAIFTTIISSLAILVLLHFYPIDLNSNEMNLTETKSSLTGNFHSGFEKATPFSQKTAIFYEFKPFKKNELESDNVTSKEPESIVLFLSDKRSDTQYMAPYLKLLANNNFTVVSADFFSKDCRWLHNFADNKIFRHFVMCVQSLSNPQQFMSHREFYTYNSKLELEAMINLIYSFYGSDSKIFVICDEMGKTAVSDYQKTKPGVLSGSFSLDSISDYKTVGYGCIEQTDPLLCRILGYSKDFDFTLPKLMAEISTDEIRKCWPAEKSEPEITGQDSE